MKVKGQSWNKFYIIFETTLEQKQQQFKHKTKSSISTCLYQLTKFFFEKLYSTTRNLLEMEIFYSKKLTTLN